MRSRCLIDWCSPNRGCVVADEAQNVQYSRWRCVSSVFMRIREEYVWCVIGVVVRRTISRIARWSSPLGDDSDLGKPLCVCVWSGDGWDLESGRLRLSIGVCPEIGGLVIVILSPVGFRRRILVGEDGEGCPNTCFPLRTVNTLLSTLLLMCLGFGLLMGLKSLGAWCWVFMPSCLGFFVFVSTSV